MSVLSKYKKDIIFLLGILIVSLILVLYVFVFSTAGTRVTVSVSGEVVKTFPLNVDTEYTIEGKDGGTNHLVINDGKAYLDDASCPDGLCINMGKINKPSQSIICLPNEVVIGIDSQEADDEDVDLVIK